MVAPAATGSNIGAIAACVGGVANGVNAVTRTFLLGRPRAEARVVFLTAERRVAAEMAAYSECLRDGWASGTRSHNTTMLAAASFWDECESFDGMRSSMCSMEPSKSARRVRRVVQRRRIGMMTPKFHCSAGDTARSSPARTSTKGHHPPRHDMILCGTVPTRDVMNRTTDLRAARMVRAGDESASRSSSR